MLIKGHASSIEIAADGESDGHLLFMELNYEDANMSLSCRRDSLLVVEPDEARLAVENIRSLKSMKEVVNLGWGCQIDLEMDRRGYLCITATILCDNAGLVSSVSVNIDAELRDRILVELNHQLLT